MHTLSNLGRAGDIASLDAIKELICENFTYRPTTEASPLDDGFAHHFKAIGGQTRARFALECCHKLAIGARDAEIIAASIEALHNASLVLDDVQDNSTSRRGHASVAHEYGDNVAIGLAHRLVATSFGCLTNLSHLNQLSRMIKQINRSIADTIDGQTYDLSADRSNTSLEENLKSAKSKSGPLFALAFELPLIFAELEDYLPFAHTAACQFGLGYQIIDDLKDRTSDEEGGQNSNIALVMELTAGTTSSQDAIAKTVQIGFDCLTDAREQSRALPNDSGESLVWASERLLNQLKAFNG